MTAHRPDPDSGRTDVPDRGLSVVLGTFNRRVFLKGTIDSIRRELGSLDRSHEIIVVDGGSTDGTLEWLARQKDIVSIVQHNRGNWRGKPVRRRSWGYFMNLGFKCAQGKYVCMLSDDCLVVPGAITNGIRHFETLMAEGRNIGAVAFYWRNWPDMKDYWVGLTLGGKTFVNHGLYLRKALEAVHWIDEDHYRFYHADGDLCLQLWHQGYEVTDCPTAYVEHFTHANPGVRSSNATQQQSDWQAYVSKWAGVYPDMPQTDWIYRSYDDPCKTVRHFPSTATAVVQMKRRCVRLAKAVLPQRLLKRIQRR